MTNHEENDCCADECSDDKDCCTPVLQIGKRAPDFELEGYLKGEFHNYSLKDFRGKWVVVMFYPLDFTFVCPTELMDMNKRIKAFEELGVQVLGISVDSVYSHKAWLQDIGDFDYPLLSDMTKHASYDYNVLLEDKGIALRGTFIIDPDGILKTYSVNDLSVGRSIDETLRLVEAFQTGDLCPVGWKKGQDTLGKA